MNQKVPETTKTRKPKSPKAQNKRNPDSTKKAHPTQAFTPEKISDPLHIKTQQQVIAAMIRVDHAGEYGAVRIYQGQLDALRGQASQRIIEHMHAQEQEHLRTFENLIIEHRVRPSILNPLWHVGGYALGYLTGKLGEKAAMACTVAVEEVIDEHYSEQETFLETSAPHHHELKETITRFRHEELEHRNIGLEHGAAQTTGYLILSQGIKTISKLAIWLSKRL